ncbi:hypothetical protein Tco_1080627 [Tanacetum coccineum]|uniref:Aminotransferase-like plant mobile domain-containing protein n=1 Tax=Tanacetum coccineum TaxID=301880 RepID=A0ABQ5HWV3_9ASTR
MDLYHSRLTRDDLNDLIIRYKIPRDLHPFASRILPFPQLMGIHDSFACLGGRCFERLKLTRRAKRHFYYVVHLRAMFAKLHIGRPGGYGVLYLLRAVLRGHYRHLLKGTQPLGSGMMTAGTSLCGWILLFAKIVDWGSSFLLPEKLSVLERCLRIMLTAKMSVALHCMYGLCVHDGETLLASFKSTDSGSERFMRMKGGVVSAWAWNFIVSTLKKAGDWFFFAKRHAPSPVCLDDNRSCMKHWKSGFFLIDRRAIPDAMVWRHPDAAIDDPRPADGSFSMADVRRLSAHVIKLRDMPNGVLVLSGLSREDPHLDIRPTLQRFPIYCTPHAVADAVIPNPTLEDPVVGTPSAKILAKAEASQKRKASTFGATSSHVAKRTSDGDDDACVEIPLVTPLRSAAVIPSLGNQGRSSTAPAAEGPNTQDSRGKGITADDAAASSVGVSRLRPSFGPVPSFRDVSEDAIHADFFPFSAGPYYATYPQDGVAGNCEFTREDLIMSQSTDSGLKGYEEKVAGTAGLELQVSTLKKQVARLSAALNQATILEAEKDEEILRLKTTPSDRVQGELLSLAASAGFERGLSMHRTKDEFANVLKNMANFMPGAQDRLAEASLLVARTDHAFLNKISEHATEPLSESTVTPASKSLELFTNVDLTASIVASEHNEEMVNAKVDRPDPKMTDDTVAAKSRHAFVQGISVALEDAVELVEVGSGRASYGPNDVVVTLSVGEKGDGFVPSSAAGEEAATNSSRV